MPAVEFHSIHEASKPEGRRVHHSSSACPSGNEIPRDERKSGTGEYRLCKHCEKHSAASYHSAHEAAKPTGKRVHHNHKDCQSGQEIPKPERVSGTGGYRLCKHCEDHHAGRPVPVAYHSAHETEKPASKRVHHNHTTCPSFKEIPAAERVKGTGGYRLCKHCEEKHAARAKPKAEPVAFHSVHEAEKPAAHRVYHNHKTCLAGKEIPKNERVKGSAGYRLCDMCKHHHAPKK